MSNVRKFSGLQTSRCKAKPILALVWQCLYFISILSTICLLYACMDFNKPKDSNKLPVVDPNAPLAAFSWSETPKAGQVTSFYNKSKKAVTYEWNFGDGATSIDANPQHVFVSSGTFIVKLIAYGNGKSHAILDTITVSAVPKAMLVTRIEVLDYPSHKGTKTWDSPITGSPPPDIYVKMFALGNVFTSTRSDNTQKGDLPLSWPVHDFSATFFDHGLEIGMYDADDLDKDDFMCGEQINIRNYIGKQIIDITSSESGCRFRLYVKWLY